jgi:hypothetical protein
MRKEDQVRTFAIDYFKCPQSMTLECLASHEAEPLEFPTLSGIFNAYRNGDVDRPSLVEAIHSWQVTEAKRRLSA